MSQLHLGFTFASVWNSFAPAERMLTLFHESERERKRGKKGGERERERDRQTDRQTDRQRQRGRSF